MAPPLSELLSSHEELAREIRAFLSLGDVLVAYAAAPVAFRCWKISVIEMDIALRPSSVPRAHRHQRTQDDINHALTRWGILTDNSALAAWQYPDVVSRLFEDLTYKAVQVRKCPLADIILHGQKHLAMVLMRRHRTRVCGDVAALCSALASDQWSTSEIDEWWPVNQCAIRAPRALLRAACAGRRPQLLQRLLHQLPTSCWCSNRLKKSMLLSAIACTETLMCLVRPPSVKLTSRLLSWTIEQACVGAHKLSVASLLEYANKSKQPCALDLSNALKIASASGNVTLVECILGHAGPVCTFRPHTNGALLAAVRSRSSTIVQLQLKDERTNAYTSDAVLLAARNGDVDIIKLLQGHKQFQPSPLVPIALVGAVEAGHIEAVRVLLNTPNVSLNGHKLLHAAAACGRRDVLQAILTRVHADNEAFDLSPHLPSLLTTAVGAPMMDALDELLSRIDGDVREDQILGAFEESARYGKSDALERLLPFVTTQAKIESAINAASFTGSVSSVQLLMRRVPLSRQQHIRSVIFQAAARTNHVVLATSVLSAMENSSIELSESQLSMLMRDCVRSASPAMLALVLQNQQSLGLERCPYWDFWMWLAIQFARVDTVKLLWTHGRGRLCSRSTWLDTIKHGTVDMVTFLAHDTRALAWARQPKHADALHEATNTGNHCDMALVLLAQQQIPPPSCMFVPVHFPPPESASSPHCDPSKVLMLQLIVHNRLSTSMQIRHVLVEASRSARLDVVQWLLGEVLPMLPRGAVNAAAMDEALTAVLISMKANEEGAAANTDSARDMHTRKRKAKWLCRLQQSLEARLAQLIQQAPASRNLTSNQR